MPDVHKTGTLRSRFLWTLKHTLNRVTSSRGEVGSGPVLPRPARRAPLRPRVRDPGHPGPGARRVRRGADLRTGRRLVPQRRRGRGMHGDPPRRRVRRRPDLHARPRRRPRGLPVSPAPRPAAAATAPVPAARRRPGRLSGAPRYRRVRATHRTRRGPGGPHPDVARPGGRRGRGQGARRAPAGPAVLRGDRRLARRRVRRAAGRRPRRSSCRPVPRSRARRTTRSSTAGPGAGSRSGATRTSTRSRWPATPGTRRDRARGVRAGPGAGRRRRRAPPPRRRAAPGRPGTRGWVNDPDEFLDADAALTAVPSRDVPRRGRGGHGAYVGLVRVSVAPRWAKLGLVGVRPGHRRRGLARALVAAAFRPLRDGGVELVLAEADAANEPARALLAGFGARRTGGTFELVRNASA